MTLLALLELIKQNKIQAQQDHMFGEIVIERQISDEPILSNASPVA